jgi:hypothetical protein
MDEPRHFELVDHMMSGGEIWNERNCRAFPNKQTTTGMARGTDGRAIRQRLNIEAAGVRAGQPSPSAHLSAYRSRRRILGYTDGGPRRKSGRRRRPEHAAQPSHALTSL